MFRIAAVISALAIAGCATPDAATMQNATDLQLCQTFARSKLAYAGDWTAATMIELERRNALTAQEVQDINHRRMRLGMSEHAAVCSWGPYARVNRTVGPWGVDKQFVMEQGAYVYTRDGRVRSFQN